MRSTLAKRGTRCTIGALVLFFVLCGCKSAVDQDKWNYRPAATGDGQKLSVRIDFLEDRLKSRPRAFLEMAELAGLYLQRGKEQRLQTDIDKAKEWTEKSLKNIDNPSALLVKADLLQMTHRFDEALEVLDQVDKIAPNNESAISMRVRIDLARGDVKTARKDAAFFEKLSSSSAVFLQGQVLEGEGKSQQARESYQRAIRAEGDGSSASEAARRRAVLARLELGQGNLDEAEALLESAHSIPVSQPLTEQLRAELFLKKGRHKDATALLRAAFEQYRDPLFLVKLGIAQKESGDTNGGQASLEAAVLLLKNDSFGHERDLALALFYLDPTANRTEIDRLIEFELARRQDEETRRIAELVKSTK